MSDLTFFIGKEVKYIVKNFDGLGLFQELWHIQLNTNWLRMFFSIFDTKLITIYEASSLDRIKMTKNRLEFDQKKLTTTNLNVGTWPKLHKDEY